METLLFRKVTQTSISTNEWVVGYFFSTVKEIYSVLNRNWTYILNGIK